MSQILTQLVKNGDTNGVKLILQAQTLRHTDINWAMMECIKHKQRDTLDVLLDHTRTQLNPPSDFFAGPLAWAASAGQDTDLFAHILKDAPSHYNALSSALTNLMEQDKERSDPYVMDKFKLWCDKADTNSLQQALTSIVVWNLPRLLHRLYPKWVARASEEQVLSELFENLTHCFSWGETQQGATLRHPEIYDFLLVEVSPSVAQQFLDKIAHDQSQEHFQYMPGKPEIYANLQPVFESVLQYEVLHNELSNCAIHSSGARKM